MNFRGVQYFYSLFLIPVILCFNFFVLINAAVTQVPLTGIIKKSNWKMM